MAKWKYEFGSPCEMALNIDYTINRQAYTKQIMEAEVHALSEFNSPKLLFLFDQLCDSGFLIPSTEKFRVNQHRKFAVDTYNNISYITNIPFDLVLHHEHGGAVRVILEKSDVFALSTLRTIVINTLESAFIG